MQTKTFAHTGINIGNSGFNSSIGCLHFGSSAIRMSLVGDSDFIEVWYLGQIVQEPGSTRSSIFPWDLFRAYSCQRLNFHMGSFPLTYFSPGAFLP